MRLVTTTGELTLDSRLVLALVVTTTGQDGVRHILVQAVSATIIEASSSHWVGLMDGF